MMFVNLLCILKFSLFQSVKCQPRRHFSSRSNCFEIKNLGWKNFEKNMFWNVQKWCFWTFWDWIKFWDFWVCILGENSPPCYVPIENKGGNFLPEISWYIHASRNQIIFEIEQNFLLNHKNFELLSKIYIYAEVYICWSATVRGSKQFGLNINGGMLV